MQETKKTDGWGKLEIIGKIIAAIVIPGVIAYWGYEVSKINKTREGEVKFVEMATNILAKEPEPNQSESSKGVRQWAIDVINKYSEVPIPKSIADAVVNKVPLPSQAAAVSDANAWAVVFGGDRSVKEAQHEINKAKGLGIEGSQIFLRAGSYRSVKVYDFREDALQTLEKVKKEMRPDSYLVSMAKWCPSSTDEGSHFACKSR